jgi:hypothetical protein
MHFLIGLCLALALLCFWLQGHWFARILAFLLLTGCLGFVLWALLPTLNPPKEGNALGFLVGLVLAWPIASLPTYYWRHQFRAALGVPTAPSRLRKLWRQVIGPDPDHPTPSCWPPEAKDFTPSAREGFVFGVCCGLAPIVIMAIIALGVALASNPHASGG